MKSNWLSEFISILPDINDAVNQVDDQYKQTLFKLLVEHALIGRKGSGVIVPPPPPPIDDENEKYKELARFLKSNNLTMNDVHNLIDLESGTIITRNLGKSNSEIQRNLGVIIAIKNCAISGAFIISKDELRQSVNSHNAYDPPNFSGIMKKTTANKRAVFVETDDGSAWKVVPIQESYIADSIKKMSGIKE